MKVTASVAVALAVGLAVPCDAAGGGGASSALPVREAVLRYQMHRYGHAGGVRVWFIEQHGADPSRPFLGRLSGDRPIEPVSASVIDWKRGDVRELSTGRRGTIFSTWKVRWLGAGEAVVGGRVYWGPQAALICRYTVLSRGGHWVVAREEIIGRS